MDGFTLLKTKDGKLVKCKQCGKKVSEYLKAPGKLAKFCSYECIAEFGLAEAHKKAEREQRKADKQRLAELNDTVRNWTKKAQVAFNAFIRERDKGLPCVSCDATEAEIIKKRNGVIVGGVWDAGHFRTRGANPELRFEELNAFKQCKSCNAGSHKNGRKNVSVSESFREEVRRRIGDEKLEWLEGPHEPKRYRVDELKEITKLYKEKLKALKDGTANRENNKKADG